MGQQLSKVSSSDFFDPDSQDYFLSKAAYTGSFIGLLFLLSWWYGRFNFEQRFDPLAAANEERDIAVQERDDAQRAWGEMGARYERALESVLKLDDKLSKASKDLPWLEKRNYELAEENAIQNNEIERLKPFQRKYDDLLHEVSTYGMRAQRPENYQRKCEEVQRQLEITNNDLRRSQLRVETLDEQLDAQSEKANREIGWLRTRVTKNSRSTAYWAKFRTVDGASKPAWGIRCACTEPEVAYSLKDQAPRIVELEAIVAARDLTINRLRGSRSNVLPTSTSWESKTTLPSTEDVMSSTSHGVQTVPATLAHTCEHEQRCKDLGQQVADDAEIIRQLRKECQDLKDAASNRTATSAAEIDVKDAMIEELQAEKMTAGEELATKDQEIGNLREEKVLGAEKAREESAEWEQESRRLRTEINGLKKVIEEKNSEISDLEEANQDIAHQPATESPDTLQRLETANTNLDVSRRQYDECQRQSETQATRINELETTGREFEGTTKLKDQKIAGLEERVNELETAGRQLEVTANRKDDDITGLQVQINELKVAGRELEMTIKFKDDNIVNLQAQVNQAPSRESVIEKDRQYRELYDHYNLILGKLHHAEAIHNADRQALITMQQELAQVRNNYTTLRNVHQNCDGRISQLSTQLRQGAHNHTDLQVRHNAQEIELEKANQNVRELQIKVTNLQQANTHVQQITSSSENDVEKYRVEGEERARQIWQAKADRDLSAQASKLEASENKVFKLENQLRQAKPDPLREVQLKSREDAIKLREEALKVDTDAMDHDQQAPKGDSEVKAMEVKLAAANKEAGNGKLRNRGIQNELNKERKERKDEKERHEREMKKEKEEEARRTEVLKIRLETENPLKGTVRHLQNEVANLKKTIEEQKS